MMDRRRFLKLMSLVAARAIVPPLPVDGLRLSADGAPAAPHSPAPVSALGFARALYVGAPVRLEPSTAGKLVARLKADETQPILAEIEAKTGSAYNKVWYQLPTGYVHSANVHPVPYQFNSPMTDAGDKGFWGEVTVPFTDARVGPSAKAARTKYRYFGGTVYKVNQVVPASDGGGELWYRIEDEIFPGAYFVPGKHVRPVSQEEFTPLSPEVDPRDKKIVVNVKEQRARAFEKGREVLSFRTATGHYFDDERDFRTPPGSYFVYRKTPTQHMYGGAAGDSDYFDLPGIPWVSYFTTTGIAFHGVYWHNDFGVTRSHGCVNCRTDVAKWIWRWTLPGNAYDNRYITTYKRNEGTAVEIA